MVRLIAIVLMGCCSAASARADSRPELWNIQELLTKPPRLAVMDVVSVERGVESSPLPGMATMRIVRVYRGVIDHDIISVPEIEGVRSMGSMQTRFSLGSRLLIGLAGDEANPVGNDDPPMIRLALSNPTAFRELEPVGPHSFGVIERLLALASSGDGAGVSPLLDLDHLQPTTRSSAWLVVEAISTGLLTPTDQQLRPIAAWALADAVTATTASQLDAAGSLIRVLRERGLLAEFLRPVIALCDSPRDGLRSWSSARRSARWSVAWFAEKHGLSFDKSRGAWEQLDDVVAILKVADR